MRKFKFMNIILILFLLYVPLETFSQIDTIQMIIDYKKDSLENWNLSIKKEFFYNENFSTSILYFWLNNDWNRISKKERITFSNNDTILVFEYKWENNNWQKTSKIESIKIHSKGEFYIYSKKYTSQRRNQKKSNISQKRIRKDNINEYQKINSGDFLENVLYKIEKGKENSSLLQEYIFGLRCGNSKNPYEKYSLGYDEHQRLTSMNSKSHKRIIRYKNAQKKD